MERRAGQKIEEVAKQSMDRAAKETYKQEMRDVSHEEMAEATRQMGEVINDLGVGLMPDASPSLRSRIASFPHEPDVSNTDNQDQIANSELNRETSSLFKFQSTAASLACTPLNQQKVYKALKKTGSRQVKNQYVKRNIASTFPSRTRSGMSLAVDTAWHKRGFDSLTSHTFFLGKSCYGKKVGKAIVKHRACGTCKWWSRHRPNVPVRPHRCVKNHQGSAHMMESTGGIQGVKELNESGTPVEYLEGDGDNTLIARLKE